MNNSEIQIFTTKDGKTEIEVQLDKESVWLNQYQLESLFETNRTSINRHISNIYKTEELEEKSTCAKIAQVQKDCRAGFGGTPTADSRFTVPCPSDRNAR